MFTAIIICQFVRWCSISVKALNSVVVGLEGQAFLAMYKDHQTSMRRNVCCSGLKENSWSKRVKRSLDTAGDIGEKIAFRPFECLAGEPAVVARVFGIVRSQRGIVTNPSIKGVF